MCSYWIRVITLKEHQKRNLLNVNIEINDAENIFTHSLSV